MPLAGKSLLNLPASRQISAELLKADDGVGLRNGRPARLNRADRVSGIIADKQGVRNVLQEMRITDS